MAHARSTHLLQGQHAEHDVAHSDSVEVIHAV